MNSETPPPRSYFTSKRRAIAEYEWVQLRTIAVEADIAAMRAHRRFLEADADHRVAVEAETDAGALGLDDELGSLLEGGGS